jgi:hypothetical protein
MRQDFKSFNHEGGEGTQRKNVKAFLLLSARACTHAFFAFVVEFFVFFYDKLRIIAFASNSFISLCRGTRSETPVFGLVYLSCFFSC